MKRNGDPDSAINGSCLRLNCSGSKLMLTNHEMIFRVQPICCGVSSYTDWDDMINWNNKYPGITDPAKLPLSCCKITRDSRTKEFKGILLDDFINPSDCLSSRKTGTYNTVVMLIYYLLTVLDRDKQIVSQLIKLFQYARMM